VLQNFTTEELAEELCRRTSLGKELKWLETKLYIV
jgi:hypothetical protein